MTPGRRHRWLARVVLRRVAEPRRSEWLADLEADWRARRERAGTVRADAWFIVELVSLAHADRASATTTRGARWRLPIKAALVELRRAPVFFLAASLTLAAGVAVVAGTAGFIDAILLRPISRVRPHDVFRMATTSPAGGERRGFSFPEVQVLRAALADVGDVSAAHLVPIVVRAGGDSEQTLAEVVTGPYFDVLASPPLAGRPLRIDDDRPGAPPVAVISDAWWASRFSRAPDAIGRVVHINNGPFTIVGVAAASGSVTFVATSTDVWVTASHADALMPVGFRTDQSRRFSIVGRVRPGASRAGVEAAAAAAAVAFLAASPRPRPAERLLVSDGALLAGTQRQMALVVSVMLIAMAVLVLVVICANVSNLTMARWTTLRRATAIRLSLGASRGRVIAQALLEGLCVAGVAAVVSLGAYFWLRSRLEDVAILPTLTLRLDLRADVFMIAGVCAIAALAGVLLSVGPALAAARIDVIAALRDASGALRQGRRGARLRRGLVALQVALSFFLIVMAALFFRSLAASQAADLGVDVDRLTIVDLDVEPAVPKDAQRALVELALERLRATPGVAAVAQSGGAPVDAFVATAEVRRPGDSGAAPIAASATVVDATYGYFETVGVPILHGRGFRRDDAPGSVAVVSETLAGLIGDGGGLETDIQIGESRRARVVGIARNARIRSVSEAPHPHLYLVAAPALHQSIVVRAHGDPRPLMPVIQRTLDGVGPGIQGFFPRTGRDHLGFDLLPVEIGRNVATVVGGLAVLLSALGLYGLVAWLVELRRPEFGLRLALGAGPDDLRRLVIRQAAASVWPGVALGLAATTAATFALRNVLFGVGAIDPLALLAALTLVATIVVAAAWAPARRAARIDPSALLRS